MTTQHGGPGAASPSGGPTPPGGGPLVVAARDLLAGLDAAPLPEHVRVYDALHDRLASALADPEVPAARPGPGRPGR